jgi:hypothetical protein
LLLGRFDMQSEGGILDGTHLHHYTLKTAREIIEKAGLEIQEIDFMPAFSVWLYQNFVKREESKPPKKMIDRREFRFYERRIYPVERFLTSFWPRMFANEFLFICCPKPG